MRIRSLALVATLLAAAACQDQPSAVLTSPRFDSRGREVSVRCAGLPRRTTALVVSPATTTLSIGGTVDLAVANQAGVPVPDCAVTWSSANTAVVTVSATGLVTGVGAGTAVRVLATAVRSGEETEEGDDREDGKAPTLVGSAAVSVLAPVASVTLTPVTASIMVGATQPFVAILKDANGNVLSGRAITWGSSNAAVASVDASGVATAVAAGTVTVTATSEGQSAASTLAVLPPLESSGWIYWNTSGHYYKFISASVTWDDAARDASLINIPGYTAQLSSLATQGEQSFMISYLSSLNIQVSGRPYIWFGVYQDLNSPSYSEPSGGWSWLSGETFDGSIWGAGEPNNATILGVEHVGAMNWYIGSPAYNGTFVDFPAAQSSYFIGYVVELTPKNAGQ